MSEPIVNSGQKLPFEELMRFSRRLSNARDYNPDELRELQAEAAKAWADVPDAAEWVRDLRGGNL